MRRRSCHKAYPSDKITPPVNPNTRPASTDTTFQSVIEACQYMGLFTKIADAAGKNLTVASFTKAGYGLKNVTIPGMGGPISYGPGQPYAIGNGDRADLQPQDPDTGDCEELRDEMIRAGTTGGPRRAVSVEWGWRRPRRSGLR